MQLRLFTAILLGCGFFPALVKGIALLSFNSIASARDRRPRRNLIIKYSSNQNCRGKAAVKKAKGWQGAINRF